MHVIAKIVSSAAACLAGIAPYSGFECNMVSNREILDILSTLLHNACRFVAKDDRLLDLISSDTSMLPVMHLVA